MAQHRYLERLLSFADYASHSSHLFPPIIDVNGGTDCLLQGSFPMLLAAMASGYPISWEERSEPITRVTSWGCAGRVQVVKLGVETHFNHTSQQNRRNSRTRYIIS